jgi:hypothetical protein
MQAGQYEMTPDRRPYLGAAGPEGLYLNGGYSGHGIMGSAGGSRLVVDLSGVDYTSSAGLRALLATVKETRRRGGDLRLADINPNVRKVLDLSGFATILKIYTGVDEAVASFAS